MSKTNVHPMAIVEPGAQLGDGVTVEAYAIVKENVILEDHVTIKSHAYIDGHTTIKKHTTIWPSASIGTQTQDLKFSGEKTFVEIGEHCHIREFATINSSTQEGTTVRVGNHCLIMSYCHIAHHCTVGNHVIMSNNSLLAGHVDVEDYAIIGGMTPVHQFVRIGCHAMVGGMSRVTNDVPPYTLGGGIPYLLGGINRIGLKRRGFAFETRRALAKAFRLLYRSSLHLTEALDQIEAEIDSCPEIKHFVEFCRRSKRGLIGVGQKHSAPTVVKNNFAEKKRTSADLLLEVGSEG